MKATRSKRRGGTADAAWSDAYEAGLGEAWDSWDRGDWLMPLVYATRSNDERLARALIRFARSRTESVRDADAALAVLEVADATLTGDIDRDVCTRIAGNLLDEAYAQLSEDHRFDLYFTSQCASAAARVAARVERADSLPDAINVVHSAAAVARLCGRDQTEAEAQHSEHEVRRQAAEQIRSAVGDFQRSNSRQSSGSSTRPKP